MADLLTIKHGEPQWDTKVNNNFAGLYSTSQELTEKTSLASERIEEKDGVVLTGGWQKNECYIDVLPLLNGSTLKICHLSISHPQLAPTNAATLLIVPSKAMVNVAQFIGASGQPGFYGIDANHIGYYYQPSDNQNHDVKVNTTYMYF